MPTDIEKKKNELGYNEPYEPTLFEKIKYFFARLFSTVVHFFKNLFGKVETETPVYSTNQKIYTKETQPQNETKDESKDVDKIIDVKETPVTNIDINNTENVIKDDVIIEKETSNNDIPALGAPKDDNGAFVDDNVIEVNGDGDDVPLISVDMLGESDDIFAEVEDTEQNDNQKVTTSNIEDEVLDDETFEFKSLKDVFFENIRDIDSRAIAMDVNKDSLSIIFELEDESNILITLMQNGEIQSINRMEPDFEHKEDEMDFSAFKRKMTPITINEIGFGGTAEELSKLMQGNPDIINEIYNSKNEIERRENKMIADAMQVKVDNIEDLKDILLGYLETANRNVITYDMQDKTILVKLPTRDSQDGNVMEMERDLVINLTDMSYRVKVEKMDFSSRSGGYKTDFEDVDLNELGAKFVAIHEAVKANKEFFDKDLSTDGPVEEVNYEEYIEDIFEDEDERPRSSSRQIDKEKTMARNAAIKNKENSRSQRNDDDEEKKPQRKQHFRHNRDDDDYDL